MMNRCVFTSFLTSTGIDLRLNSIFCYLCFTVNLSILFRNILFTHIFCGNFIICIFFVLILFTIIPVTIFLIVHVIFLLCLYN